MTGFVECATAVPELRTSYNNLNGEFPMAKKPVKASKQQRILNLVPSKETATDWQFKTASRTLALGVSALPPKVDLRASWWKVGDQGQTGSCVGWASTDGVMRYHLVKAGKLGNTERLSPRYTWMASKETDEFTQRPGSFIEEAGTSLKAAADICRKYGVVKESLLPFGINTAMYLGDEDAFYAAAAQMRASSYFNLGKNFNEWRRWLATKGPIMAGLSCDANWMAGGSTGKLDAYDTASAEGGHAICVVGYTADRRFIIRNSWATTWGDKGFAYASEGYINAGFFPESYGFSV